MINKLSLGTVQLGLPYGISNISGKVSRKDAFEILEYARKEGIDTLDTAYSYGESEETIGEFISECGVSFNIVSKLPDADKYDDVDVERYFSKTLKRLRRTEIYGYLVHRFDDILKNNGLLDNIRFLKEKGLVQKIGVSIYMPEELEYLLKNNIQIDILQFPYSVFDRRFEGYLDLLKKKEVELYARSVFLQGLAFLNPDDLRPNMINARENLMKLQNLSSEQRISVNAICLNFALLNEYIDKVIVGVENLAQLKENIEDIKKIEKVKGMLDALSNLYIDDDDIILPYRWEKV